MGKAQIVPIVSGTQIKTSASTEALALKSGEVWKPIVNLSGGNEIIRAEFFLTCGRRWNQRTSRNDPIVQFEIQRWQWHFLAQP
jgi:hypothetical protein